MFNRPAADPSITGNHQRMKRNEHVLSLLVKIYFFTCLLYAGVSLFLIILAVDSHTFGKFLDGIVGKSALFALGFLGCYRHDPRLTWAAAGVQVICVCLGSIVNVILLPLYIACAVANMKCAAEYHYLEQQPGFPQFSEIFEEQKESRRRFEEGDPFEERRKQLSANNSSDMNELDFGSRSTDNGSADQKGAGYMDEI